MAFEQLRTDAARAEITDLMSPEVANDRHATTVRALEPDFDRSPEPKLGPFEFSTRTSPYRALHWPWHSSFCLERRQHAQVP